MIYIGVDPGQSGGWCVFGMNEPLVSKMPVEDERVSGRMLEKQWRVVTGNAMSYNVIVAIEKVHAMPKQGVSSSFKFGRSYEACIVAAQIAGYRVELVTPQAWKKVVLAGMDRTDQKAAAIAYCQRAFPNVSLVLPGCRKPHDGIADAICIAEYARRIYR